MLPAIARAFFSSDGSLQEFEQHRNAILESARLAAAINAASGAVAEQQPRHQSL